MDDHRQDEPGYRRKRSGFFGGLLDWLEDWANEDRAPVRGRGRRRY